MALSIPFVRKRESAPGELKQLLSRAGIVVFAEDTIDHGVKLHAVYRDLTFALILYFSAATGESSKIVLEKATEEIAGAILEALGTSPPPVPPVARGANPLLTDLQGKSRIGIDESGKGDYFGPLTIAGVCINPEDEALLVRIGVRDSKLVNDNQAKAMAEKIRLLVGEKRFGLVQINPEKYNELYGRIRNLNKLLAWGHAGLNNRGVTYGKKGESDKAIADFDEAIRLEPNDAEAYYNRGKEHRQKGDSARAEEDFNGAKRLGYR